jgi:multiple sugar transport system permease protein
MTAASAEIATTSVKKRPRRRWSRVALHLFLFSMAMLWLLPLAYALYTSLRPYADTAKLGYFSIGGAYNLDNYVKAFTDGQLPSYFLNTLIVVVPAVFLTLLLASMAAFVLSRYSWRFNLLFLMLFTAGNLLPQQVIITPLFRMYLLLPLPSPTILSDNGLWYDQYFGVIAIHVAFQLGFCTFVLSNYMKTLPHEMVEAAVVDGAGVFQVYRKVIMPLVRPAFAALVVLETTWIYNDFFWALLLMKSGDRMPITSALNSLKGNFFTDNNLIAAGAIIVALPTMIVFFAAQKQFISGLTLGSTKG